MGVIDGVEVGVGKVVGVGVTVGIMVGVGVTTGVGFVIPMVIPATHAAPKKRVGRKSATRILFLTTRLFKFL